MKTGKILTVALATLASAISFDAVAWTSSIYHISDMTVECRHDRLTVDMKVDPKEYRMNYNRQIEVIPVLKSKQGNDSVVFPSFVIAGRNAYYNSERAELYDGTLMRAGHGEVLEYSQTVDWEPWMEYSRLDLQTRSTGCCGVPAGPGDEVPVALLDYRPIEYVPVYHYEAPIAETSKQRRIEGKAYVSFPVNRIEIYPDYMINPQELRKITSSIDTVRLNPDATVKSITLTGYASPEGPYSNNVRLAKGRTEAVKEYVRGQYTFPASVFHANSVPEDWDGLRDSVAVSILSDRTAILDFIDNGNVPIEKKNDEMRKRFPRSYDYLLKNVYPWLRHTNYAIDYELRTFTDTDEIQRVLKARPGNLSLNEFFLAAKSYPIGSEEYDKVFETAVLYYPDSEIANLNAANSAMNEGDLKRARMLLGRISETPAAIYALAVLDAMEGDYDKAKVGMARAKDLGVEEASEGLAEIARIQVRKDRVSYFEDHR